MKVLHFPELNKALDTKRFWISQLEHFRLFVAYISQS